MPVVWLIPSAKEYAVEFGVAATYGAGVYLSLKGKVKALLKDFSAREKFVGTKLLLLDFAKRQLVASEVFVYAPEKNRVQTMEVRYLQPVMEWLIGARRTDEDDLDSLQVKLRLDPAQRLHMRWADSRLSDPLFSYDCDSTIASQKASAEARANEILVQIKRRLEACDSH